MQLNDTLDQLLSITRTGEFEDNGRMRVVSAQWSADRLAIRLEADHGDGQHSSWQLRFTGVLAYRLEDVFNCGLNVWEANHPVLAQYTDRREFLHFSAPPRNATEAIGELWSAHVALNREPELTALLMSGSGLFATGPSFLIDAYARVLDAQGCGTMRKELPRSRTINEIVMIHFGKSHAVAERVTCRPAKK
ncbi:MAG TPA: hypothetical protein VJZ00_12055 [Thermoanaerobaculia bacterium]|nr:hypothetical protein [Thermoanaerobaculia bacterium]